MENGCDSESSKVQGAYNGVTEQRIKVISNFSASRSCTGRRGTDENYSAAIEEIVRADKSKKKKKEVIEIFLAMFEVGSLT